MKVTGKADEVHGKAKATIGQASDTAQAAKDHATGKVTDAYNTVSVFTCWHSQHSAKWNVVGSAQA